MSFILDALKKSENERQRHVGPGLFETKIVVPRPRWPAWAFALAALLIVNMGVVGWLMWRAPAASDARAAVTAAPPATTPSVSAAPQPAPVAPPPAQPAEATTTPAVVAPIVKEGTEGLNPEDYEPATEPAAAAPTEDPHVRRGTVEGLPTYEQVAGTPGNGLPQLRLDLHVYAAKPQDRFVFLNMHRLREGDSLPEGVRIDSITPDGAILSFRGTKFVLDRE